MSDQQKTYNNNIEDSPDTIQEDDVLVNLKTLNDKTELNVRLIPRTKSEAVIESDDKQFISKKLKESIYNKQDNLGYTPVNKSGDSMSGPLYLLSNSFTEDNQAVTKNYVDNKIKQLVDSSPEALDTLYELAAAINNDPNFAVTVTNLISNKLNASEVSNIKTPNKLLRTDSDGDLVTNIKGNANTATKLSRGFTLNVKNDYFNNPSVFIDGSQDIDLTINTPLAGLTTNGLMSAADYNKLANLSGTVKYDIGAHSTDFSSSDFKLDTSTNDCIYTYNTGIDIDKYTIGLVQIYRKAQDNENVYSDIQVDTIIDGAEITIKSLITFNGRLIFNLLS